MFFYDCNGALEKKTLNHRINSPAFSLHQPTSITVKLNSFLKFLSQQIAFHTFPINCWNISLGVRQS